MEREKLSSRLGFILVSAGCAIGIGNVYKFPIMTGANGGGLFVLIYLAFLVLLGIPVMTMELAVGRASNASIALSFDRLEKKGQKWHIWKYFGMFANYLLMMCYLTIVGIIALYLLKYITGDIMTYKTTTELHDYFIGVISNPVPIIIAVVVIVILGFGICAFGLKNGVERVTKVLMVALLAILLGLAIYCCTLSNAGEGIEFYLVPSTKKISENGVMTVITSAMSQAFFTLSLGIGSIAIFGSYISKKKRLTGEAIIIIILDTVVALLSGFIIFPACFTYAGGVNTGSGVSSSFVFETFASVFNNMAGGRILGIFFFILLFFAAFSTVIAVFENIMSFWLDLTKIKRKYVALINMGIMAVLAIPSILAYNVLSGFTIFGVNLSDLMDITVSNILLPVGCLIYCLFCTSKFGWGYDNYMLEVNTGEGAKMPKFLKVYNKFVLPLLIVAVLVISIISLF